MLTNLIAVAFQKVPPANETAKKLMSYFLNINPRTKRQNVIEDIVVVMDGSGSIGSCEFTKGKKALQIMIGVAYGAKVAAVTFASSATVNFKFMPYNLAANKMIDISYPRGSTNTQAGLTEAKKLFDDSSSGINVILYSITPLNLFQHCCILTVNIMIIKRENND